LLAFAISLPLSSSLLLFNQITVLLLGDDTYVEKNLIYNALFEQSPYDDIVQTYLEILLPSLGEMKGKLKVYL
jgi:hypothetical protein